MNLEELFAKEKGALGEQLKQIRRHRKLRQKDLKQLCGIGKTRMSEIESGKTNLTFETLFKLSIGLKTHLSDLWNYGIIHPKEIKRNNIESSSNLVKQKLAFGSRLATLMSHRKLRQGDLAILSKTGESELSNYIKGDHNISMYNILKLATGLEVKIFDLFDFDGPLPNNKPFKGKLRI